MKRLLCLLAVIAAFACFSVSAHAEDDLSDEIRTYAGMDSLLKGNENADRIRSLLENPDSRRILQVFGEMLGDAFTLRLKENAAFFSRLAFFFLFAALWKRIRDAFSAQRLTGVFDLLVKAALGWYCFQTLSGIAAICEEVLKALQSFLLLCLPVWTALAVLGGKVQTAAAQNSSLFFALEWVETLSARFLFPFLKLLFALHLTSSLFDAGINRPAGFLSKTVRRAVILLYSLLAGMLAAQNALAQASDGVLLRGVRFAAGNFIPVVGNLVGESAKTIAAGVKLVRTECGLACVVLLFSLIAPPILSLFGKKIALSLAGCFGEMLGEKEAASFLKGLGEIHDLAIAVTVSSSIYFLFAVFLMVKTFGG